MNVAENNGQKVQTFTLIYTWDTNGYCPDVRYELGISENGFTMHIAVPESDPRRVETEHFAPVCLDSCVEWFVNFMPECSDKYFNFEVNAKSRYQQQLVGMLREAYPDVKIRIMGIIHP